MRILILDHMLAMAADQRSRVNHRQRRLERRLERVERFEQLDAREPSKFDDHRSDENRTQPAPAALDR